MGVMYLLLVAMIQDSHPPTNALPLLEIVQKETPQQSHILLDIISCWHMHQSQNCTGKNIRYYLNLSNQSRNACISSLNHIIFSNKTDHPAFGFVETNTKDKI